MKKRNITQVRVLPFCSGLHVALFFISFTFFSHGSCGASEALSITEILERVQQRYGTADFEADFVQESYLKAMGIVDAAKGHVYFRPPAMMRWHYKAPEQYLIITDGQSAWVYWPLENQVMVGGAEEYLGDTRWTEFFNEPNRLLEGFVVQLAAAGLQREDQFVLKLLPKKEEPNLAEMLLFISKSTFEIVQSVTSNAFGDKTIIRFEGLSFNQGLDASLFKFHIPKEAEVFQLETQ